MRMGEGAGCGGASLKIEAARAECNRIQFRTQLKRGRKKASTAFEWSGWAKLLAEEEKR
jgi:hypothetical protein